MRLLVLVSDAPGRAWLFCFSHLFCSSGHGSRTINAPFGDSHDGRNAGVWAAGSRSLSEEGPVASRLGTHSPVSGVYANHPPLIYVETAAAELLGFGTAAATRAPAWAGSLIVLILLGRLLRESGVVPAGAGIAVLLVATAPMFLVYGTMLDTPMTSLPFGVGLLLLWERARRATTSDLQRPAFWLHCPCWPGGRACSWQESSGAGLRCALRGAPGVGPPIWPFW